MRQTVNILIISVSILTGCSVTMNTVETLPIHAGDTLSLQGYVYTIPQTSFKLNLDVVRTRTIRGPYYRFAEKFLSIKDVPVRNSTRYRVSRVQLGSFEEADPDNVFLVRQVSGQTDLSAMLKLGSEGLIYDTWQSISALNPVYQKSAPPEGPVFTELSMERNTAMSIDTFYKTILTDTSFIRVPVLKEHLMVKTIDEKANEAAEFILELRYERFMMLTGNNNTPVTDYSVQRLDEIEREYLELFIGKTFEERIQYTYYINPSGEEVFENIEIVEFSESRGILEVGAGDSEALSLSIRKTGKTNLLVNPLHPEKLPVQTNALYYRVPDVAEVEVSLGRRILLSERYPVYQYGEILSMPVGPAE